MYRLQDDSALIGQECTICFEDFVAGKLFFGSIICNIKYSTRSMKETLWQDSTAFVHTTAIVYTTGSDEAKVALSILLTELLCNNKPI